jgi:hypothetical protein
MNTHTATGINGQVTTVTLPEIDSVVSAHTGTRKIAPGKPGAYRYVTGRVVAHTPRALTGTGYFVWEVVIELADGEQVSATTARFHEATEENLVAYRRALAAGHVCTPECVPGVPQTVIHPQTRRPVVRTPRCAVRAALAAEVREAKRPAQERERAEQDAIRREVRESDTVMGQYLRHAGCLRCTPARACPQKAHLYKAIMTRSQAPYLVRITTAWGHTLESAWTARQAQYKAQHGVDAVAPGTWYVNPEFAPQGDAC